LKENYYARLLREKEYKKNNNSMVYAPFVTNHKLGNYETFRAGLHNSIK
jgi:hypothetical protein